MEFVIRTGQIRTVGLIARHLHSEKFLDCCRSCSLYGQQWSCPPLDFDTKDRLSQYPDTTVYAAVIDVPSHTPMQQSDIILSPVRHHLEELVLGKERLEGGWSASTIGHCMHCPDSICTRPGGKPCRHPELVRPSLEALGFDVSSILAETLGLRLQWSTDGFLPGQLILVAAHFH